MPILQMTEHIILKFSHQIIWNLVYGWNQKDLMHPVINQIGVDTQNEVVKEEKRLRVDNSPYGNINWSSKEKHVREASIPLDNHWFYGTS